MSFHGSLADLPIVDVLQLLNATRKTGTLKVTGPEGEGALTLREGLIVSVIHPNKKINIGSVLVGMGIASPGEIELALAQQSQNAEERKPLLAILIEAKLIEKNLAFKGLERLIEMAIGEIIKWKEGSFTLDSDSVTINDDFRFLPGQIVSDATELKVDTQQVLLNALRSIDESHLGVLFEKKSKDEPGTIPPGPNSAQTPAGSTLRPEEITDQILGLDQIDQLHPFKHEKQIGFAQKLDPVFEKTLFLFSTDFGLQEELKKPTAQRHIGFFAFSDFKQLTDQLNKRQPKDPPQIVILDVGPLAQEIDSQHILDLAKNIMARFPHVAIGFIYPSDNFSFAASLPLLGGIPALNKPTLLTAEHLQDFLDAFFLFINNIGHSPRSQVDPLALNQHIACLIDQKNSNDVSGTLLKILTEIFHRVLLFGVRRNQLLAINALGTSTSLDDFSMEMATQSLLAEVMEKKKAYWGTPDAFIRQNIFAKISPPNEANILLLPLKAQTQVVAVVYADFGEKDLKPFSTNSLEILASFAGVLLENSLFEKQIQKFSKTQP